jgi:small subunit ribosomal protein S17
MSSPPETGNPKASARKNRKVGTVVSAKMQKSVVVEVTRFVRNTRYGRIQKRTARFLVDDRVIGCRPGDVVEIEETRPLSARKRWRVRSVVTRGRGAAPEAAGATPAS